MTSLQTLQSHICDPTKCSIAENCPVDVEPGQACPLKTEFMAYVTDQINSSFKELDAQPMIRMRLDLLLKPMLEQLLILKMEQANNPNVYFGAKINPLFKELRNSVEVIDRMISDIVRSSKEITSPTSGLKTVTSGNYYDMVFLDGKTSVEDTVGPPATTQQT